VLGLEVVLADGRVLSSLGSLRKDNTGYDLNALFVGAEGTLGIITAATLRLFPQPAVSATAFAAVNTLDAAIDVLAAVRAASADRVSGCEIMARSALELVLRHIPGSQDPFAAPSPWYLLLELQGTAAGGALDTVLETALATAAAAGQISDAVMAASGAQRLALWRLRESIAALACEGAQIKHDVALPVTALPAFHAEAGPWILGRAPGARLVPFGHLGDGNLHYNVSLPAGADRPAFEAVAADIERGVHDIARRHGGSFSAEHGIGQYKLRELQRLADPVELAMMRSVKRALDPNNIMNPGKLLGRGA
jgi:FAD/FMN-containing dehydrogenase